MQMMPDIKIIIADDHEIFRDGFKLMLSRYPEIQILGEAENGKELLELTQKLHPDIVITDIKMPLVDGIEASKKIRQLFPEIGIIALSMFDEDDLIIDMLEAGAKGYLLKNSDKQEIIDAIISVYNQNPYFGKSTSSKLAQMIARSSFNPYTNRQKEEFTEREKEIVRLICKEYTNREIGEQLFISARTVEGHRMKIMEKMNVKNTVGLVVYAIRHKIFTGEMK